MKYDIAAKVVIDADKDMILREFLKLDLKSSQYIENLPEETVSLRRSDFPLRVTLKDGRDIIVLIEIQTVFNKDFVIRLGDEFGSWLMERRRDIMIESPIYRLIREDALKEGMEKGLEQGLERGKKEGIYEALSLVLEIKFGVDGIILMEKIRKIDSMERLETIKQVVKIADKIEDIEKLV